MLEGIGLAIPFQDTLKHELGFTVGIDWAFSMVLSNRSGLRLTINCSARGEDEFMDIMLEHDIEEIYPTDDVILEIPFRVSYRVFYDCLGCHMHYGINFNATENFIQSLSIANIGKNEFSLRKDCFFMPLLKVVQNGDFVTPI